MRIVTSILLATHLGLSGAAQAQSVSPAITTYDLPDFTSFVVTRPGDNAPVSIEDAGRALKDYDVIFVGEQHGHVANHLAQMGLLRSLHRAAPQVALSMEQFERDQQQKLDDYLAGKAGEQSLLDSGWRHYAQSYRPLVEYAKEHRLPVIASNAPQAIVRCVGREGPGYLQSLSADRRKLTAAQLHLEDGAYKQKFFKVMSGAASHGATPADEKAARTRIDNSYAAQVTRDDTMAESIATFLGANPSFKVFHITGSFHVGERLGTIERLAARSPHLKIALVMPLPLAPSDAGADQEIKGAQFVIHMRRLPEPYATEAEKKAAEASQAARFRSAQAAGCKS